LINPTDSIVVSPANHLSADMGGEYVILGIKDEMYYGVDGAAARIWQLIQEPRTFDSIVETIASEFEVERDQAAVDAAAFVEDLAKRSIVEVTPL
jgi:hypothetical protein